MVRTSRDETPALTGGAALVAAFRSANLAFDLIGQSVESETALGRTDLRVLQLLVEHGPLGAGDIAELTGLTSGSVSALLKRLEEGGCLRRRPHAEDGRRRIVRITPKGRERWLSAFGALQAILGAVAADLSDAEMDVVLRFLQRAETVCRKALSGAGGMPGTLAERASA